MSFVAPALGRNSFNCPSCRALAHQYWFTCYADGPEKKAPELPSDEDLDAIKKDKNIPEDVRENLSRWHKKLAAGIPLIDGIDSTYINKMLHGVFASKCLSCSDVAIWIGER
jgi:hypothetical protein